MDWSDRAAWQLRPPSHVEDIELRVHPESGVALVFARPPGADPAAWRHACELWLEAPAHPALLDAQSIDQDDRVIVRYAALDWHAAPRRDARSVASWGLALARAYEPLVATFDDDELGWLTAPVLHIDLDRHARVAFTAATPAAILAPEVRAHWPRCDERGLIHRLGQLMVERWDDPDDSAPLAAILSRCLEPSPRRRYLTLADLCTALRTAKGRAVHRSTDEHALWTAFESGLGYVAVDAPALAISRFESALHLSRYSPEVELRRTIRTALDRVRDQLAPPPPPPLPPPLPPLPSSSSSPSSPSHLEINALLLARAPARALAEAGRLPPDDGTSHYLRGKCLLALSRLIEARAAFDHALTLAPHLIAALILRCEVDRALARLRATVGERDRPPVDPDDPLAEHRLAILAGRVSSTLSALSSPEHASNPAAQELLASCLILTGRPADALAVSAPPLCHARALLALDRPADALVLLEPLLDRDALDLRARALRMLNRPLEADALDALWQPPKQAS